jgi:hypothetical protein
VKNNPPKDPKSNQLRVERNANPETRERSSPLKVKMGIGTKTAKNDLTKVTKKSHVIEMKMVRSSHQKSKLPRERKTNLTIVTKMERSKQQKARKSSASLAKKEKNNRKKTYRTKKMKVSNRRKKAEMINQENAPKMVMIPSNNNKIQILTTTRPTALSSWEVLQQPLRLVRSTTVTSRATRVTTSTISLASTLIRMDSTISKI